MAAAANPCDANIFSQVFSGNAIVCSKTFKDYETDSATEQIQSVVDNANTNYGEGSSTAQIAASVAAQQEAQVSSDVDNVTDAIANSTAGQIFTTCPGGSGGIAIPGLPCINYSWIIWGIVGLVVLYAAAVVSSFIPRPR